MKKHLIYALTDPRTNEIRYVGRSSSGLSRPNAKHSGHCGNWVKNPQSNGYKPSVKIIQQFDSYRRENIAQIKGILKLPFSSSP